MPNIAIVTSISFGGNNAACFNAGLASTFGGPTQITTFSSNGDYDPNKLRCLTRSAANSGPDLIVTAGGLVTAVAAAAELTTADPKFVFLSGAALPGPKPPALAGGVNINNASEDVARKQVLTGRPFNVPSGHIYLVVNNNSPLNDGAGWPPAKVARFFNNAPNPPTNDPNTGVHFIAEFQALAQQNPTPGGLVVSADPYFRLWRTAFTVALAAVLPVPVCYAYQDFIDAINALPNTPNINNSRALDLPNLNNPANPNDPNTAYFQLGKQAGRFLAGTADMKVVKWDAGNNTWLAPALRT